MAVNGRKLKAKAEKATEKAKNKGSKKRVEKPAIV
jgi:hypothetical protein